MRRPVAVLAVTGALITPSVAVAQSTMAPSSPPAVRPAAPKIHIGPSRLRIGILGRVPVRIRCPGTAVRHCTGMLSLGTGAGKRFLVPAGRSSVVSVKLAPRIRQRVRGGSVRLRVQVSVADAVSATREIDAPLTLLRRR